MEAAGLASEDRTSSRCSAEGGLEAWAEGCQVQVGKAEAAHLGHRDSLVVSHSCQVVLEDNKVSRMLRRNNEECIDESPQMHSPLKLYIDILNLDYIRIY